MSQNTSAASAAAPVGAPNVWTATAAGFSSGLVGIGLARFAYTPLIPALVNEGWFGPGDAAYLGAANLAGYLGGALFGRHLLRYATVATVLRMNMLLAAASFFACAWPLSFSWFFVWRFAAGLSGAVLMVLAAPSILPHVPVTRRGLVSGIIFTGIGLGVMGSGTLVPLLLRYGLTWTWLGFGVLSLLLTAVSWFGWPREQSRSAAATSRETAPRFPWAMQAVFLEYGLNAAGLVPHMIFLVDFIARGLGQGLAYGALHWVVFGLGATMGPACYGHLGDRIGFALALRLALILQAAMVGMLAVTSAPPALIVSSFVIGSFVPGIVPVALGRVMELLPSASGRQVAAWSLATAAWAVGQAIGAYGLSFVFARTGDYPLLFMLGTLPLVAAAAIDVVIALAARGKRI